MLGIGGYTVSGKRAVYIKARKAGKHSILRIVPNISSVIGGAVQVHARAKPLVIPGPQGIIGNEPALFGLKKR